MKELHHKTIVTAESEFGFMNEYLMVQEKAAPIYLPSIKRSSRRINWNLMKPTRRRSHMKKILTALAVLTVVASPAFAQISQSRAAAIESCTQQANAEYGLSGGHDWRRFNHDVYAGCMADKGQAE